MGLSKSRELTEARHLRRNRKKAAGRKLGPQYYCGTPEDRAAVNLFLSSAATFLAGHGKHPPPPAPFGLVQIVAQFDPYTLAATILVPILEAIERGWSEGKSEQLRACQRIGRHLRDQIEFRKPSRVDRAAANDVRRGRKPLWNFAKLEWGADETARAGNWMLDVAECLDYFVIDDRGFLDIAPRWRTYIDEIGQELREQYPLFAPRLSPPPDWRGWRMIYEDGLQATFLRGHHPEAREAIEAAFAAAPFEHADGVNTLQRVAFKINRPVLDLVDKLALEVKRRKRGIRFAGWLQDDERTIKDDVKIARWIDDRPFYLGYNCDFRGRVNPLPAFNFAREDHVRSMFQFASGKPLGDQGIHWLEVHAANCGGGKGVWKERVAWVHQHRQKIEAIAADPYGTFDLWQDAGDPLCFVGACIELVAAWSSPESFTTHLPVGLDATCSGVQHLCELSRDEVAGRLVNLTNSDKRYDIYLDVAGRVRTMIELDGSKWSKWWGDCFRQLTPLQVRGMLKPLIMTFAYSATKSGMMDKITDAYADMFGGIEPAGKAAYYLADKTMEACREALQRPQMVMDYLRTIAGILADGGEFLQCRTPTGFPLINDYRTPKKRVIKAARHGVPIEFTIADGYEPGVHKPDAMDGAAPNYVHALDAAHLVRSVNAAAAEDIDVVCIHDCFAVLAPDVVRFGKIARAQMSMLYQNQDHLAGLGDFGVERPSYGSLDPLDAQDAEYMLS